MKKKILWNAGFVCSCVILVIMVSSCEMFTTSFGKNSVRDQSKVLEKASASQLADMAASTESANPETAAAIMEALGKKKDELAGLSIEQKEAILNLALDTIIPMSTLTAVLEDVDLDDTDNLDAKTLVNTVFEGVNTVDTTALTVLLTDRETLETADATTLANAAIAAIAQVAKSTDRVDALIETPPEVDFEKSNTDDIVDALLGDALATEADKAALKAAVDVIKLLQNPTGSEEDGKEPNTARVTRDDIDPADVKILGLVSLEEILGNISSKPNS